MDADEVVLALELSHGMDFWAFTESKQIKEKEKAAEAEIKVRAYTPLYTPLYTFIAVYAPICTRYTCIYIIYTPLNTSKHLQTPSNTQ